MATTSSLLDLGKELLDAMAVANVAAIDAYGASQAMSQAWNSGISKSDYEDLESAVYCTSIDADEYLTRVQNVFNTYLLERKNLYWNGETETA